MIRKYRLIIYSILIAFAWFSQALFPNESIVEPITFTLLVVFLGGIYEVYAHVKKKK